MMRRHSTTISPTVTTDQTSPRMFLRRSYYPATLRDALQRNLTLHDLPGDPAGHRYSNFVPSSSRLHTQAEAAALPGLKKQAGMLKRNSDLNLNSSLTYLQIPQHTDTDKVCRHVKLIPYSRRMKLLESCITFVWA